MTTRRSTLGILGSWFLARLGKAQAPPPTRGPVTELARHALTGAQSGMEAILVEVTALPGAPSPAHRHPGFVLGYILEGEMAFAIDGETQQVVKTGGTFFEPIGALHTKGSSAKADAPVKFLAFIVAPKGSSIVLPA